MKFKFEQICVSQILSSPEETAITFMQLNVKQLLHYLMAY